MDLIPLSALMRTLFIACLFREAWIVSIEFMIWIKCSSPSSVGKTFVPKQRPIETRQEDVTTLDPELEEALSSATDTELCDLAGKNEWTPTIQLRSLW